MPATPPARLSGAGLASPWWATCWLELAASSGGNLRGLAAYERALRPARPAQPDRRTHGHQTLIPRSRLHAWANEQAIDLLPTTGAGPSFPYILRRRSADQLNVVKRREHQGSHMVMLARPPAPR